MAPILQFGTISFILVLALGIPVAMLAERCGIIDVPGSAPHKQHARTTPLAGGILVFITLSFLAVIFSSSLNRQIVAVLSGTFIIFLFGLVDDIKGLSAGPKLIGQLIASTILISFDVQVRFVTVLFDTGVFAPMLVELLNVLITLFWLVGITNAMNMIDSMDGIVAGLGIIVSLFFIGATNLSDQPVLARWASGILGVSIGLYFWNGVVVRFFLGDSGAQTLGFFLASLGILYNPLNRNPESSWIVPIMLLGVPIFDTTLVVLSRFRRKQPIGTGRRDHTYHRLIRLGMSPRLAVLSVHLMALVFSSLALLTLYLKSWIALLFFIGAILIGVNLLFWLERQPTLDDAVEQQIKD